MGLLLVYPAVESPIGLIGVECDSIEPARGQRISLRTYTVGTRCEGPSNWRRTTMQQLAAKTCRFGLLSHSSPLRFVADSRQVYIVKALARELEECTSLSFLLHSLGARDLRSEAGMPIASGARVPWQEKLAPHHANPQIEFERDSERWMRQNESREVGMSKHQVLAQMRGVGSSMFQLEW